MTAWAVADSAGMGRRYFKLFPMIAAEREGLDAYATFVTSIVSNRSKGSLQQQGKPFSTHVVVKC